MNDYTDRSTEALLARRALAEKATPGPWIEAIEPEGDFDDDLTFITSEARQENSTVEIAKLEYTDPYEDKLTEFNLEQRANAAHIAVNSPDVVIADIDEILLLRTEVQRLEKEADWLAERIGKMDECRFAFMGQFSPCDLRCQNDCRAAWREAARKAVESPCLEPYENDGGAA